MRNPILHALGDGGFVALWIRDYTDSEELSQSRLWMRVFNADGSPRGAETEITLQTVGSNQNKYEPSVTLLSNGNFVVAWEDISGLAGDAGAGLRGQIFSPSGAKVGSDFHINSRLAGDQAEVSISALANGGFAVAYTDVSGDGNGSGVRTRVFDSNGHRVLRPGETSSSMEDLVANAVTVNGQVNPVTIALKDGRYVVLFEDNSKSPDDGNQTIRGRIFKADGTPDSATDFLIPEIGSVGDKNFAAAATLSDGKFVVVWESDLTGLGPVAVKARIFNSNGTPASGELTMNEAGAIQQLNPRVVALNDGGFAISYTSQSEQDAARIALFSGSGEFKGNVGIAHPENSSLDGSSSLTTLQDGRLVVSWIDRDVDTGTISAHAQIFDPRTKAVTLSGTNGNDDYIGTSFADRLGGGAGRDKLTGAAGDDVLNGGSGADRMDGGSGNDTYHVDDAGDVIVEVSGTDTVITSVSYTLAEGLETLAATGTGAITLTGNSLANTLIGHGGDTILDGGAGADVMTGGDGNDTYHVDQAGDQVIEAGNGLDTVVSAISYTLGATLENLTAAGSGALSLSGNGSGNRLTGNAARNILKGHAGADTLDGGDGKDVLSGGAGKDVFVFKDRLSKSGNRDTIDDFKVKDDTLWLDNAVFTKLTKTGTLKKSFFAIGSKAKDKNDYLVYDAQRGVLFYDADGSGRKKAVEIARLDQNLKLTHKDFFVI